MIAPSSRLILAVAAVAPLALVIGVVVPRYWFAGLVLVILLLALALVDEMSGAGAVKLTCESPGQASVGETIGAQLTIVFPRSAPASAEVALDTGALLAMPEGARRTIGIADGGGTGMIALTAGRRGTGTIDRAWVRWRGPLGLVWKQRVFALDRTVLITPDIRPVHQHAARLLHRDSSYGLIAQRQIGEGSEFEALSEFRTGMDRRTIDWKQSSRHTNLLAKEYRTERNNNIIMAVDSGRVMSEPLAGVPRIDHAVSAALLGAFVALKDGDRVGFFGFDSRPRVSSKAVSGGRAFALLQRVAAGIDYSTNETNYTLALATLGAGLTRRSLIIVFTDFADTISAELMLNAVGALLKRHLVLFVVMRDEELEALAAAEPVDADDVVRAVTAAALLRQRLLVTVQLRHQGVHVLEAGYRETGPALVEKYLELKRRNRL